MQPQLLPSIGLVISAPAQPPDGPATGPPRCSLTGPPRVQWGLGHPRDGGQH